MGVGRIVSVDYVIDNVDEVEPGLDDFFPDDVFLDGMTSWVVAGTGTA